MAEALDRDTMIHLLNRLGSEDDNDVLEAARYLHGRVADSGVTWNDLLAQTFEETMPPAVPPVDDSVNVGRIGPVETDGDAIALIEKLISRPDISDDLRDELNGYRADIGDGVFDDADRRYLSALYERLT